MKKGRRNLRSASQRSNTFLQEKEFILKFHKADEDEREVEGKSSRMMVGLLVGLREIHRSLMKIRLQI